MSNQTMGYMALMSMAEDNRRKQQKELERKQLVTGKMKKLDPKQQKLKVGIQKFLAKQEEEEKKKKELAELKKQKLLELRQQDKKAQTRVRKMLNMTKSANKSCIADTKESLNAEDSALQQPDEDDYGYTSNYAAEMHKKMMAKYSETKSKPAAPPKVGIEIPQAKSVNGKGDSRSNPKATDSERNKETREEKSKPKKNVPPPPNFHELLKLAEEKSKEPVVITKPLRESSDKREHFEFGRPMTAKEKKKYLGELAIRKRVDLLMKDKVPINNNNTNQEESPSSSDNKSSTKPPSKEKSRNDVSGNNKFKVPEKSEHQKAVARPVSSASASGNVKSSVPKVSANDSIASLKHSESISQPGPSKNILKERPKAAPPPKEKYQMEERRNSISNVSGTTSQKTFKRSLPTSSHVSNNNNYVKSKNSREKHHSPEFRKPEVLPSSAFKKPKFDDFKQPYRKDRSNHKARAVIQSDDEEDSDMDDFIDDSEVPEDNISDIIGKLFKYNKRSYVNEDSDDECMESSIERQWKEEEYSLEEGIREDIEDEMREEEMKRSRQKRLKR